MKVFTVTFFQHVFLNFYNKMEENMKRNGKI